jgi:hypothetical protein
MQHKFTYTASAVGPVKPAQPFFTVSITAGSRLSNADMKTGRVLARLLEATRAPARRMKLRERILIPFETFSAGLEKMLQS